LAAAGERSRADPRRPACRQSHRQLVAISESMK
jgi:hypothetical protein